MASRSEARVWRPRRRSWGAMRLGGRILLAATVLSALGVGGWSAGDLMAQTEARPEAAVQGTGGQGTGGSE